MSRSVPFRRARLSPSTLAVALAGVFATSYFAAAQLGGADGVQIPWQGRLELDGVAVSGTYALTFSIFNVDMDGSPCWTSSAIDVEVLDGEFQTLIRPVSEACVVNKDVYLEAAVDDGQGGGPVPLVGRQRMHPMLASMTSGAGSFSGSSATFTGTLTAATVNATTVNAATVNATTVNATTVGNHSGDVNGVTLQVKQGNNGTVDCDSFCQNSAFAGWSGSCVGSKRLSDNQVLNCTLINQGASFCLCARW